MQSKVLKEIPAVISMKYSLFFTQAVVLQKVVHIRYHSVSSLRYVHSLVYEVIHLGWNGLTTDTKYTTLSGGLKINRPRLMWV
jgi:hypothetical protein